MSGGTARLGGWRGLVLGCLLGAALLAGTASAAPLPLEGREVDMTARYLERLMAERP